MIPQCKAKRNRFVLTAYNITTKLLLLLQIFLLHLIKEKKNDTPSNIKISKNQPMTITIRPPQNSNSVT